MDVIRLLWRDNPEAWKRALTVAALAGLANAAILAIINRGAAIASTDTGVENFRLLLLFLICMVGFYLGKRFALIQSSVAVERMLERRLLRVYNKIRHADLELIESLGRGELYTRISQDTGLISQSGLILVNAAQQSFVLTFCLAYIAWLSLAAFIATVVLIAIGTLYYFQHARSFQDLLSQLNRREAELVDAVGNMVDGFKEVRLNRQKSDAVYRTFAGVAAAVRNLKIDAQISFCVDIMFSDIFFYSLLSVVVFLLPRLVPTYAAVVLMITAAILFIIGPMQMVVQAQPVLERARAALTNLYSLEDQLDAAQKEPLEWPADAPDFRSFHTIGLEDIVYTYPARAGVGGGFSVGPLRLRIERGETIFFVGGNGSGKTTLLKLLTGLYLPQQGGIRVDQTLLGRHNVQAFRELFTTVFGQFHLFDSLYGLEGVDPARVEQVLAALELTGKTTFENGRFTDLNLSTGQRKRLALAVCLLEDREIMVFDEWAADQDPHFRRHFYEVVLRDLKARGKTLLVVTHDDRYWSFADRVVKMDFGKFQESAAAEA